MTASPAPLPGSACSPPAENANPWEPRPSTAGAPRALLTRHAFVTRGRHGCCPRPLRTGRPLAGRSQCSQSRGDGALRLVVRNGSSTACLGPPPRRARTGHGPRTSTACGSTSVCARTPTRRQGRQAAQADAYPGLGGGSGQPAEPGPGISRPMTRHRGTGAGNHHAKGSTSRQPSMPLSIRARNTIMVRRGLPLLGCRPSLLPLLRTHRRPPPSSTRRSWMQNPGRCGPPTPTSSGMYLRESTGQHAWMTCAPSVPLLGVCAAATASSRWFPTSGSATNRPQDCSPLIEGLWI